MRYEMSMMMNCFKNKIPKLCYGGVVGWLCGPGLGVWRPLCIQQWSHDHIVVSTIEPDSISTSIHNEPQTYIGGTIWWEARISDKSCSANTKGNTGQRALVMSQPYRSIALAIFPIYVQNPTNYIYSSLLANPLEVISWWLTDCSSKKEETQPHALCRADGLSAYRAA